MVESNIEDGLPPSEVDGESEPEVTGLGGRARGPESTATVYIRALLQIHLVPPEDPANSPQPAPAVDHRHDELVRELLADSAGIELGRLDNGFLLLFERPAEAVVYALAYRRELAALGVAENLVFAAGVGIHLGEISMPGHAEQAESGDPVSEIDGLAKLVVRRVAMLAGVGQILMTQMAFELARRAMVGIESPEGTMEWTPRGRYHFAGLDDPYEIFEVETQGVAVAESPPESATATRLRGRAEPTPGTVVWRVGRRAVLTTAAVAISSGGLWWFLQLIGVVAHAPFSSPSERHITLAVLGFKNLSARPESQGLVTDLPELLAAELGQAGDLDVISGDQVVRMKAELSLPEAETLAADTLRDIHRSLGPDYVLVGSYLVLEPGGQLRLSLHLQPTENGATISINATGRESELVELVSRAARDVREELGLDRIVSQGLAGNREY